MDVTKRPVSMWGVSIFLVAASCATLQGAPGGAGAQEGAVALSPPPPEAPGTLVLAAETAEPGTSPAPRPAQPGDPYRGALAKAYADKGVTEGKNADYIPELAKVDSEAVRHRGRERRRRDLRGRRREATSSPFSRSARSSRWRAPSSRRARRQSRRDRRQRHRPGVQLDRSPSGSTTRKRPPPGNPLVNAGAIATVGPACRQACDERWKHHAGNLERVRRPPAHRSTRRSTSRRASTNTRNQAIADCSRPTRSSRATRRGPRPLHAAVLGRGDARATWP